MLRVLTLMLCLLGTACSTTTAPQVPDGAMLPRNEIEPLAAWVAAQTGIALQMLPVVVASRTALNSVNSTAQLARAGEVLKGYYVPGVVVIDNSAWRPDDLVEVSYLVHELVHHAQYEAGVTGACRAELEQQAYRLQNLWLEAQGLAPLNTDDWIENKATC